MISRRRPARKWRHHVQSHSCVKNTLSDPLCWSSDDHSGPSASNSWSVVTNSTRTDGRLMRLSVPIRGWSKPLAFRRSDGARSPRRGQEEYPPAEAGGFVHHSGEAPPAEAGGFSGRAVAFHATARWNLSAWSRGSFSSRQLPTNRYHASLSRSSTEITREYQTDSPSQQAGLMGSSLARDGPGSDDRHRGVDWLVHIRAPIKMSLVQGSWLSA